MHRWSFLTAVSWALMLLTGTAQAAEAPSGVAQLRCKLTFKMSGWSVFYKTSSGAGVVKCSNGQAVRVKLEARGGGLTFGKSAIENGRGDFSPMSSIGEVFGTYVSAEAHAGAVKSVKAQAMTKGAVSLALAGNGRGFDVGVAFGALSIERG